MLEQHVGGDSMTGFKRFTHWDLEMYVYNTYAGGCKGINN